MHLICDKRNAQNKKILANVCRSSRNGMGNYDLIHQCVVGIGGPALVIGIMSKWWLHVKQSNQNWRDQATKIAPLCHTDCLLDTL